MIHPTLYKKTSTGATTIWYAETDSGRYRTVSGQIDGKKIEHEWTICTPKNVGRSNERSAEEQCQLEVDAMYTHKLHQGQYHKTIDAIEKPVFHEPMLAKKLNQDVTISDAQYKDHLIVSQPKYDGFRALAKYDGLWSRKGKPHRTAPHIIDGLVPLFQKFGEEFMLDGELYADRQEVDFDEISSILRKKTPNKEQLAISAKHVKFYLYDLPSHPGTYDDRYSALADLFVQFPDLNQYCVLTPTTPIRSIDHQQELMTKYIEAGFEGQMIRTNDTPYEWKRSKSLLKFKLMEDDEFEIIGFEEGLGKMAGKAAKVVIKTKDGVIVKPGMKLTHARCTEIWQNQQKYIGGQATIRYQEYTPDGSLRFCKCKAIYEGKRDI